MFVPSRSASTISPTPVHSSVPLTIVIKVGSSSLSSSRNSGIDSGINFPSLGTLAALVEAVCRLKTLGHHVVLVTSGAVALGCARMNWKSKPTSLVTKQAIAAVGQSRLMRLYDDLFSLLEQPIAQVLLTRDNLNGSSHYHNALNTFKELLNMGVVPVVNENDTVSVSELRFGDNDTLSALVATLINADYLFLLTDVDALYNKDPKEPDALAIPIVEKIEDIEHITLGSSGVWGTGGMATKIQAARIATSAGVRTVISNCTKLENIFKVLAGELVGTQFLPQERQIKGKKLWIAHHARPVGVLHLDEGASLAVGGKHASLFAAGIKRVDGNFHAQSVVSIFSSAGKEIARGMTNYTSEELDKIKGRSSHEFPALLGYMGSDEAISRFSLAVL